MKLIYETDKTIVTLHQEGDYQTVDEMLLIFKNLMQGMGYVLDGEFEYIRRDENGE